MSPPHAIAEVATKSDVERLEGKVDRLTEALTTLVRVETQQQHLSIRVDDLAVAQASQGLLIQQVDRKVDKWIQRGVGVWAMAATVFAVWTKFGGHLP